MNWKKIFTIAALTAFSASVATGQGTAPTIVQGDYISNVFGQSNFIKNPNAKLNTKDVTVSSATVSRSPTTPLVAASEFNVAVTVANGTVTWATRTFDDGMKNQNCEARFTYRGFQSTSKAHVKQGANTVATLNLSATGSDPRIASINFPCGDLSSATTFVITDTSTLGGVNEIGGIYVGLATNMANVSQAEEAGTYTVSPAANCFWSTNSNLTTNFSADADCNTGTVTGSATTTAGKIPGATFSNLKPGKYMFIAHFTSIKAGSVNNSIGYRLGDGTDFSGLVFQYVDISGVYYQGLTLVFTKEYTTVSSPTIQVQGFTSSTSNSADIYNASVTIGGATGNKFQLVAYRFPTSSELVVTPERQNVYGGVSYAGNADFSGTSTTAYTKVTDANFGARTLHGKATAAGTSCGLASGDFGFCLENVPPGTYKIAANVEVGVNETGTDKTWCNYTLRAVGSGFSARDVVNAIPHANAYNSYQGMGTGILKIDSFQSYVGINLTYNKEALADSCAVRSNVNATLSAQPSIHIQPLDQPSNSALFVEGPVKASATGAAIPAGYVGEIKTASLSSAAINQSSPVTGTWYASSDIFSNVGAGVWLVTMDALQVESQGTNAIYWEMRYQDGSNNAFSTCGTSGGFLNTAQSGNYNLATVTCVINSSSTFNLRLGYRVRVVNSGTVTNLGLRPDYVTKAQITMTRLN